VDSRCIPGHAHPSINSGLTTQNGFRLQDAKGRRQESGVRIQNNKVIPTEKSDSTKARRFAVGDCFGIKLLAMTSLLIPDKACPRTG
jgi:hypothetical protein